MTDREKEDQPAAVSEETKQAGEIRARWAWVEPSVWTERMLTALEQGVKGGKWFSLMDKVYALANLRAAFAQVKANGGAAGVDHQTVEMFERHLEENLAQLCQSLRDGSYRPQAVRRVWIPKPGSTEKRPLGIPAVSAYCTSYNTASECPRLSFRILEERRTHSSNSCSFSLLIVIQYGEPALSLRASISPRSIQSYTTWMLMTKRCAICWTVNSWGCFNTAAGIWWRYRIQRIMDAVSVFPLELRRFSWLRVAAI